MGNSTGYPSVKSEKISRVLMIKTRLSEVWRGKCFHKTRAGRVAARRR